MTKTRNHFRLLTLYLLGFLLLWEWLRPVPHLTDTGENHYFVIFIAVSLLLNFIQLPRWFGILLKLLLIYYFLHSVFYEDGMGILSWLFAMRADIQDNITLLASGDLYDLSGFFRSLLFFILLWLMTYLLHYWLTIRKRIFTFYLMTVVYVALLDTFTEYNGGWAIVRIVVSGFSLLGLLYFQRLLEKEQINEQSTFLGRWVMLLSAMIGTSIFIGYASPKAGPIWPDPVPFIQSTAENARSQTRVSTIGYGSDDTQLGGPFIGDDRVVFEVATPSREYWKVEVKDVYTGKGWISSGQSDYVKFESGHPPYEITPISDEPISEVTFNMKLPYPHIVRPYGYIFSVDGNDQGYFKYDSILDKITSYSKEDKSIQLDEYSVQYQGQSFNMMEMLSTKELPAYWKAEKIMEQYTQLPETLPNRVKELARDLTANHDNWFDQAKAIERYFQSGNFTYSQTDVSIPGKDQDYVDQFLFETLMGYCDNFSTSMVTMLRAVDIPARWVKGYTAGNYVGTVGSDGAIYEVTNNNAHSWVEVFFPSQGWVPFEPTKGFEGFDNLSTYTQDEEKNQTASITPNVIQPEKEMLQALEEKQQENRSSPLDVKKAPSRWIEIKAFFSWHKLSTSVMVLLSAGVGIWLTLKRRRWIPYYLLLNYRWKSSNEAFVNAYGELLKQLERFGVKRVAGQTLRDYAVIVDLRFNSKEMTLLTERYERAVYGGDVSHSDWEQVRKLWENLIKRTSS